MEGKSSKELISGNRPIPQNIICFSHLRWDFVYQRPQHLLSRFSDLSSVYYVEEPVFEDITTSFLNVTKRGTNLSVLTPHIPSNKSYEEVLKSQKLLIKDFLTDNSINDFLLWYYTPMALEFSRNLNPSFVVYDCMDELSAFKYAPLNLSQLEHELMRLADVVFTGGYSLYELKKDRHYNIFPFPSSIDKEHFSRARSIKKKHELKIDSGRAKIGFFGVIDERFDIELIGNLAKMKPDWDIILIGPVVKIDPDTLPKEKNIHYLGSKSYLELPTFLSTWDVALIPFLLNESTRFISPTKTPEYLAAGIPVVSSAIKDVINPYGDLNLVRIANNTEEFITCIEEELNSSKQEWLKKVDKFLENNSWDLTCSHMLNQIKTCINKIDLKKA